MRRLSFAFASPLLASCLLLEHTGESEGGASSTLGTPASGSTGGSDGGSGTGGSAGCDLGPAPNLVDCGDIGGHLEGDPRLCVMAQVSAAAPGGTAEAGAVALSHRAIYFLASSSGGDPCADGLALRRVPKDEGARPSAPAHGCVPVEKFEEGMLTAVSLPTGDAVFYAARSAGWIMRCDFPDEGDATCAKLVDVPNVTRPSLEVYQRACEVELLLSTEQPYVSGASLCSVNLGETPPTVTPRLAFQPGLPASTRPFAVKRRGDRLALGIRSDGDGAVVLHGLGEGLPALTPITTDSTSLVVAAQPTSMTLSADEVYARVEGRVWSTSGALDVPGVGPIAADDDTLFYAACLGSPPTGACTVGRTALTLEGALVPFGPSFRQVGGIESDGAAAYFTAVGANVSDQTSVILVRYWKSPPSAPNTNR